MLSGVLPAGYVNRCKPGLLLVRVAAYAAEYSALRSYGMISRVESFTYKWTGFYPSWAHLLDFKLQFFVLLKYPKRDYLLLMILTKSLTCLQG